MRKILLSLIIVLLASSVFGKEVYRKEAKASYYSNKLKGNRTASGERYSPTKLTCAHRKLPFGTRLLVTNLKNGKSVEVVVNDRGPYAKDRELDLSYIAAKTLDFIDAGTCKVKIEIL